jgi:hypothetical protein
VALVIYAVATRLLIATTVPAWQGPDEPKHFEYVRTLIERRSQLIAERRLLWFQDAIPELQQQIIASMAAHHFWAFLGAPTPSPLPASFDEAFGISPTQLHRPSLYYDLGGLVMLPLQQQRIDEQLLAMRLLSAVLAASSVIPVYVIGRLVSPTDTFVPIACAALTSMLPMAVFIGGMMNVDNFLLLLGMLVVLAMTRGVVRGFTARTWLVILGGTALALLTKRGAVILLPGVLVCIAIGIWRLGPAARMWAVAAFAALTALAALASWLLRFSPVDAGLSTLSAYALNDIGQWYLLLKVPLASGPTWQIVIAELNAYFDSFWGIFGWFTTRLAEGVYSFLLVVTAVCAIGCIVWLRRLASQHDGRRLTLALLFGVLILSAIVAGVAERLAYYSVNEVPQGRYLFVVLGAIAPLYAVGWRAIFPRSRVGERIPMLAFIGGLAALDVYAYVGAILPYFSRPFMS